MWSQKQLQNGHGRGVDRTDDLDLWCLISLRGGYLSCATLFVGAGIDFLSCIAGTDVFFRCILQILLHCRICNWWHLKNGEFYVDSVM